MNKTFEEAIAETSKVEPYRFRVKASGANAVGNLGQELNQVREFGKIQTNPILMLLPPTIFFGFQLKALCSPDAAAFFFYSISDSIYANCPDLRYSSKILI
jgi:hypothetical protein